MKGLLFILAASTLAFAGCGGSGERIGGEPGNGDGTAASKQTSSDSQAEENDDQTTTSVMATRRAARIQAELSALADAFAPIAASRSAVAVALLRFEQSEASSRQTVRSLLAIERVVQRASVKVNAVGVRTTVAAVQDSLMDTAKKRRDGIDCLIDAIETAREIDECQNGTWNDSLRQARLATTSAQEIRQTSGLNPGREDQFR